MPELQAVNLIEIKEYRHLGVYLGWKTIQVAQVSAPFQGSAAAA